ncbi:nicotinate-nucleotide--dimethylbenzimidazole phosphoribosyltransferase [Metabacillus sp. GX 13764]|uniref:nicotinate-nucleotide--dimethylbenzimidazole phosphoribosyltransferase n=1 Tax=Metabacillus kandeliae TaxID=2900151 RepID=UPI001E5CFDBD|nr:nicotinate-nucleotide--dimethylbenzimidazole phosphoribosyltransferase [Metabacillus kandeliae]MCD7035830.1 nicotinate-nucleotide--dimethylbenzimidazole phosphoribosyltransferase [Metabacillus kandeliae]
MLEILAKIHPSDKEAGKKAASYIDTLTKPPGSLGRLEEIAIKLAEIFSSLSPEVTPPGVLVFAGDHGIVSEGVSAFPQEVTQQMVANFLNGGAAINVFSRQIGAKLAIIDTGIAGDLSYEGLSVRKIRHGTRNFLVEDAMTREEAEASLLIGYEEASKIIKDGAKCLIPGEMGIGNTTSSSAIISVLSGISAESLVGRGTGINAEKQFHKQQVISKAIEARKPNIHDPVDVLAKVGGYEIGGMAGAMLAAAANRIPVLADGFISTAAAFLAAAICPAAKDFMLASHLSEEAGHEAALKALGLDPILKLNLRLGEGSGAAIAFPIILAASLMIREMATFEQAGISGSS